MLPQTERGAHDIVDVAASLRFMVECVACKALCNNMYTLTCGHIICQTCIIDAQCVACTRCGTAIDRMPMPVDELRRNVLYYVYGQQPPTRPVLRDSILAEMHVQAPNIRVAAYMRRLETELDTLEDVSLLTRCKCNMVCVRTPCPRNGTWFYGCPAWRGKGTGCGYYEQLRPIHKLAPVPLPRARPRERSRSPPRARVVARSPSPSPSPRRDALSEFY